MILPSKKILSYFIISNFLFAILALNTLKADPFTIVVIGDQQVPLKNPKFYSSFTAQIDWITAKAKQHNIRFVTQVGDIVEHGNNIDQWDKALAAMQKLDTAVNADGEIGIPWNVNYGNHEVDKTKPGIDPAGVKADNYRQYFGVSDKTHRYSTQPQYKGVSPNGLNTYHIIQSTANVNSRKYLMLNLEFDVPGHPVDSKPSKAEVPVFDAIQWAQGIINSYPGMPTIITTHVFEGSKHGPPNKPYTKGKGRNSQLQIFKKLINNNAQIFMVFSGHTSQDSHSIKKNAAGLQVLQMVTDYNKVRPNGGDGFLRLVEIDEKKGEVSVKTYTPGVPQNPKPRFDNSSNGQFTLTIDWPTRFPKLKAK